MKKNQKNFDDKIIKIIEEIRFNNLKAGAKGILGTILDMCNNGKTVNEIKDFCEKSLNPKEMKK